jgi:hypothetical protein
MGQLEKFQARNLRPLPLFFDPYLISSFEVKAGRGKSTGYTEAMTAMATRNLTGNEPVGGLYLFGSCLRAARTEGGATVRRA